MPSHAQELGATACRAAGTPAVATTAAAAVAAVAVALLLVALLVLILAAAFPLRLFLFSCCSSQQRCMLWHALLECDGHRVERVAVPGDLLVHRVRHLPVRASLHFLKVLPTAELGRIRESCDPFGALQRAGTF